MALACEPLSGLFGTGLMLWFSGSTISIFPIMMIIMNIIKPIQALYSINQGYLI